MSSYLANRIRTNVTIKKTPYVHLWRKNKNFRVRDLAQWVYQGLPGFVMAIPSTPPHGHPLGQGNVVHSLVNCLQSALSVLPCYASRRYDTLRGLLSLVR